MNSDTENLDLRLELLKHELIEYKIYVEICAITLFFLMISYIKKTGIGSDSTFNLLLNYLILISSVILFLAIVLMTSRIIYLINTDFKKFKHCKKLKIDNIIWALR